MRRTMLTAACALAGVMAVVVAWGAAAQGQAGEGSAETWNGRTAWGDPDLMGKWQYAETTTPMERPAALGNKEFFTDEEVTQRIEEARKRQAETNPDEDVAFPDAQAAAPAHEKGIRGVEYNRFWVDSGERKITRWNRTSYVIDPPDGRIPPFTPEAVKRIEAREVARRGRGESDSWEDRNINERCLQTAFIRTGGGERQIFQAPGYFAIQVGLLNTNEPIVVPLDGRPFPSSTVRTWVGVSRGRWEGTTLVVETKNINGLQDGGPVMASRTPYQRFLGAGDTVTITERYRRVSADLLEHTYTITDPSTYVRPYTVLRPLVKAPDELLMPENACHEGNYGIVGQLMGGRSDEAGALLAARAEAAGRQAQLEAMKRRTEEWVKASGKSQ